MHTDKNVIRHDFNFVVDELLKIYVSYLDTKSFKELEEKLVYN